MKEERRKKEKKDNMQKGKEMKEIRKNTNIFNWVLKANRDREKLKREKIYKGKIKPKN